MHSDSPLDAKIKGNMVRDMLNIAGLQLPEPSDTNSHTVIPSCFTKPPPSRQPPTDLASAGSQNTSVQVQIDVNGVLIAPAVDSTDPDSSTGTVEQPLRGGGDTELTTTPVGGTTKKIRVPSHEWVIDSRLHMTQLSADERDKRRHFVLRALQHELPKPSICTPANSQRNMLSSANPSSNVSSLGMGNNNYQYSPDSVSSKASIRPVGSTRSTLFQSSTSAAVSRNSSSTEDNLPASNLIRAIPTGCRKTARSMGIGPSSPDLRSHRIPHPSVLAVQTKETQVKPPTAPASIRTKLLSRHSTEISGIRNTPSTPSSRSPFRSGYTSGTQSPVRTQTLPRVRLASATVDILECLTPSDVRILIGMVDELERAGGFECIFPPPTAGLAVRYLSYFEAPRYPNLLCIAYLQKYGEDKEKDPGTSGKQELTCAGVFSAHSVSYLEQGAADNQWSSHYLLSAHL
ncbi:unnamed protein product [Echinostoma caproni]|uniref:Flocculation protein FLO11-like n=1 Tax=Echinostoma caproni TaxID=27848 RepID=A0A183AEB0_9TREM|nr:unnamed protein product [Echinostoma caproni]